jgi:aminopeptidase N
MTKNSQVTYLKDYQVPAFIIETTDLDIRIGDEYTSVVARLKVRRNPASSEPSSELVLQGGKDIKLQEVMRDGLILDNANYDLEGSVLSIHQCPETFELTTECLIQPQLNESLEGLYKSGGMYCTQCEAEGFRNITYYLDRPDALSVFTTRIRAPKASYPILLANGNPVEQGDLENGEHFAVWHDPFPKPAYLFAMVAGDLVRQDDEFTTLSGRKVDLQIFVEAHNSHKCDHALASLKRSMLWDEQTYGREYDLDLFMIVAVDDFNMGAMENKGLNIFNSDCVLADPATSSDAMFERIEGIVAHEYFHNWSGNRVTCRDWFQLSLKEGFTVYRDSQYTADTYSAAVKRIDDVTILRTHQFAEDASPMAHPIRPASYIEINNFYSVTVYEKGAEVVGMIHTLLGDDLFRKGSDLYFDRHDGQAVTTDDFVAAMSDASGIDLSQFTHWYSQAGTPTLAVTDSYNATNNEYSLTVAQSTPATAECEVKLPFHLPLRMALLDTKGLEIPLTLQGDDSVQGNSCVLNITQAQQTFIFEGIAEQPTPSLLRGFSAPVKLDYAYTQEQLLFLASKDQDGFCRWEACQRLLIEATERAMGSMSQASHYQLEDSLVTMLRTSLVDETLDPAMVAKLVQLPSEAYLAETQAVVDVDLIHAGREAMRHAIATALEGELLACYQRCHDIGRFSQTGMAIGRRALKNTCLSYLNALDNIQYQTMAQDQYTLQANMTDVGAALHILIGHKNSELAAPLLAEFYQRWQGDAQVVCQWFAMQCGANRPGLLGQVKDLLDHKAFDIRNPNKVRSVVGSFIRSAINFHALDGSGYAFVGDMILKLDRFNPMIAAGLAKPLGRFKRQTPQRQVLMQQQLRRLSEAQLSKDVFEVVSRALSAS